MDLGAGLSSTSTSTSFRELTRSTRFYSMVATRRAHGGTLLRMCACQRMHRWRQWPNAWYRLVLFRIKRMRRLLLQKRRGGAQRSSWALAEGESVGVDEALSWRKKLCSPNEVLVVVRSEPITRKTMCRLRARGWLNDELINGYLGLVAERCADRGGQAGPVHVMSTYFYVKLCGASGYDYGGVRRWTKGVDLRGCSLVLIPVNVGNEHWILVALDVRRRRFDVWDSFRAAHPTCIRLLRRYISDEWRDKYGEVIDVGAWQCEYRNDAPLQSNGWDCGVFVCAVARCLALEVGMDVSQELMGDIRRRIVFELMQRAVRLRKCERASL